LLNQPPGVGVSSQDLLVPVLEPPIQPGSLPVTGPVRQQIDHPVEEPPDGAGREARDGSGSQAAANQSGAARAMNPIVFVVRRLVITLTLVAMLAFGGVLGLSKLGVDVLPPQHMHQVRTYADYVGAKAMRVKEFVVNKFESFFHKPESEHHSEHHKIIVTSPTIEDVTITQPFVCQIRAQRHIDVRALEGGYLQKILVKEGQMVKEGMVMFQILPILYQRKFEAEQAEAQVAVLKWQYADSLAKKNVVSPKEVALAYAEMLRAQAKRDLALAEVQFTDVKAPFDGIVDRLQQREGSLIKEGKEGDILTTLSDNSVMWVYFNVPEKYYLEYMANREQRDREDRIELMLANGDTFPETGKIGAIEADFNNENGNIKFRADYPNPHRLLRHGQTGTIKIRRPFRNALVIPQRATFEVLDKRYVKVINENGEAHQKLITIKHELDDIFLVNSGLDVKDKIIFEGAREIEEGEKVEYEFLNPEELLKSQKNHAE
jgi:membrane fusion protein, multidrug efflux system